MKDEAKTKEQLINELVELRRRITELEKAETKRKRAEEKLRESNQKYQRIWEKLLMEVSRDITECKRMEEALRESEEKYRSLVESSKDSIYLVDGNCKYLFMNNEHLSRLGLQMSQVMGRTYGEFHSPEETEEFAKKIKEVLEAGKSLWYEYRSERDNRYFIRTLSPVKDSKTRMLTAVTVISKDITKRKRAEEALKDWIQALETKTKELEDFTFIVSHDLKEPLRGIASFSQFVLKDYADKLDERGEDYLLTIRKNAEHMKRLIDDLLALSRVTRIDVPFQVNKASEIIEDAVKPFKVIIDEKDIELVITQDLPTIYCDKIRMVQVFENLLSNAIKFMDKENPKIEIGYQDKIDYDQFYIKDNGIGIEEQYHQKIFEMFERLHRREDYRGTGAGLHICKKIIEKHRGKVWVESEPGVGSTFYFTLPKKKEEKEW